MAIRRSNKNSFNPTTTDDQSSNRARIPPSAGNSTRRMQDMDFDRMLLASSNPISQTSISLPGPYAALTANTTMSEPSSDTASSSGIEASVSSQVSLLSVIPATISGSTSSLMRLYLSAPSMPHLKSDGDGGCPCIEINGNIRNSANESGKMPSTEDHHKMRLQRPQYTDGRSFQLSSETTSFATLNALKLNPNAGIRAGGHPDMQVPARRGLTLYDQQSSGLSDNQIDNTSQQGSFREHASKIAGVTHVIDSKGIRVRKKSGLGPWFSSLSMAIMSIGGPNPSRTKLSSTSSIKINGARSPTAAQRGFFSSAECC
ncbi:hypothetical protein BC939DRAFT_524995 [Gamsiella multidivaricata]|uniref:uncharacterized protein n=1 Tax=Gamsiella multidivaricata TaxID=101098 RepID=UPI002220CB3C|nr:uncharacterized protein BC939DRAFT_524995 [Gamsiella multidivaricata]KAI7831420.1 hypothetical protein BC939DRAFT_524995 [Gamsiella multidivaricata]